MPWLQLKFGTEQAHVDAISDFLMELDALSLTYEDAEDRPILEPLPGETPLWDSLVVTALFDANINTDEILQAITSSAYAAHLQNPKFEALEDKDWVREWMDSFKPIAFGERLWIVPSWHQPPDPDAVNILLDPGLAFGTGTHPTTALCLQWLDGVSVTDKTVLDYGCGSGILAIAATLLGARATLAIDIDPQALTATRDNMQRNNLATTRIEVGLPAAADERQFDLVIANILAGPLQQLAPAIAAKVAPGGQLVLSGLLAEQAEEISQVYAKWFNMQPATQLEDWVRLEGSKKDV
ncbi:MAG: 50S ribosomal protein L11 methyltransferase [Gammaproteobacteria bacterium]|nr:50S ribosomal protein L11 methyltransferase [Gammaproteobacteria bacterium]NVK88895.1 50S ribosomal protein L11 methyltransferase [Gammaproteobacteria bacterium]